MRTEADNYDRQMRRFHRGVTGLFHCGWLCLDWWQYLFEPIREGWFEDRWFPRVRVAWCRATGHGSVGWYNPCGFEPDMTCQDCGDDLG